MSLRNVAEAVQDFIALVLLCVSAPFIFAFYEVRDWFRSS